MSVRWFDRWLWRSARPVPHHPQTRLVTTSGAVVRVRDTGGLRPALVFLCDPPNTIEHYDALIAALGPSARVIVVELPGFGFSRAARSSALGFDGAVDAIEEALAALDSGPVVLAAPCITGFVAVALTARARLEVSGLVLLQVPDVAGIRAWTDRMDPRRTLRRAYVGQLMLRLTAPKVARLWYRFASARGSAHDRLADIAEHVLAAGGAYSLATMMQDWRTGPFDGALAVPTLVVWGAQDRSHAGTDRRSTLRHAEHATITELPQCGHFCELEDPEATVALLLPFAHQAWAGTPRTPDHA